jgi:hypothetical protein
MVQWESRGPGDTDNALRRVARQSGVQYGAVWSLRYRAPKRIWADVYVALSTAYETARQRQLQALQNDIDTTAAVVGHGHPAVAAALAALGQDAQGAARVVASSVDPAEAHAAYGSTSTAGVIRG